MRSVIKGKRVMLRRPRMSDADAIAHYCNDRSISKWIPRIPHPYTRKHAVHYIKEKNKNWKKKTDYEYVIEYNGKLIGTTALRVREDDRGVLGWWVGKPYRGKGIATEAAKLIMQEGFKTLNLHRIDARFIVGNKASERVMKKLGMKYEAKLRESIKRGGEYLNSVQYVILRREFKP
jgi:RimJ/RimL family protein N-acetyltransferase